MHADPPFQNAYLYCSEGEGRDLRYLLNMGNKQCWKYPLAGATNWFLVLNKKEFISILFMIQYLGTVQFHFSRLLQMLCNYVQSFMVYYVTPQQKSFIPSLFPPSSSFPKLPREAVACVLCVWASFLKESWKRGIVLVVMCYNEVSSGFPIANSVPLLARWPI